MKILKLMYVVSLCVLAFTQPVLTKNEIGVASAVNKNTTDLTLEEERKLVQAGYKIIQNHTIETDSIGRAQMLLVDGTAFSVGPNSSVTLDKFIYNPKTAEGTLEVTSKGLLRLVGGKVTKKKPALIRTNSATVGIRGGITIVQTQGLSTTAAFIYGDEMTVTPNQNPEGDASLSENGFVVTVATPSSSVEYPIPLTSDFLSGLQEDLEAREEESDDGSDDESEDESDDDTSDDDTSDDDTSDDDTSDDDTSSDNSNDDSTADNDSSDEDTTDNSATEETSADSDDDSQPDVNEDSLDSSGVSDNSSDVNPDELSTADDLDADTEIDVDTTEESAEEVSEETSEVANSSSDDSVSINQATVLVEEQSITLESNLVASSFEENTVAGTVVGTVTATDAQGDDITLTLSGAGSENFSITEDGEIVLVTSLDYEDTSSYNLTVTASDGTNETTTQINFSVTDVDESINVNTTLTSNSFSEDIEVGTTLATIVAIDPEGEEVTFSLSGEGSENFSVNEDGEIILVTSLDYENYSTYNITLNATDGTNTISSVFIINVDNVNEPITLTSALASDNFSEDAAIGTVVATYTGNDPEGSEITYSLSGTGSENFSVTDEGTIVTVTNLDYESINSFTLTLSASDGTTTSDKEFVVTITNVDEPVTLSTSLASDSFAEDLATGSTIVSTTASDPEGQNLTYTLTGDGSENFSISDNGSVILLNSLNYENQTSYTLILTASDGTSSSSSEFTFSITDVNEAIELAVSLEASSFSEGTATGTTLLTSTAVDAEGDAITFSLSGTGSENFSISEDGTVTLLNAFDYETAASYTLTLSASDGTNTVNSIVTLNIDDVNEAASLDFSLEAESFSEDTSTGTTIAITWVTDPENDDITYTLSGTGSENFTVSNNGTILLSSALDYETATSYNLTLTVSDGTNETSKNIAFTVNNVNETPTLSTTLASSSFAEDISTGTTIATSTASDPENGTITYTLSGTGSDKFSVSSSGVVTLTSALDYETTTSYDLTLTASDGTNTVTDNLTVNVTDVDLSLSASLASSSQSENTSTGTTIATSSSSNAEGTVTYSLTDSDNKFSINSSTGVVTLVNSLDYETKTSHQFTVTASDGVTTVSQTFTLNVSNAGLESLAVTLANSGAALAESSSSGTAVATTSISNPENLSITYTLSGTGSNKFAVDSSGNVTTNAALDFETTKSYNLTLTATGGGYTLTDNFTVNVSNTEELKSAVLRYSAAFNSPSRSGFSATATRGPTGSTMPAYILEQVGLTNTTAINSVAYTGGGNNGNYVPVKIGPGTQLNWYYYWPFPASGVYNYTPVTSVSYQNRYLAPLDGVNLGGAAVDTLGIDGEDYLSAGRLEDALFWYAIMDKSATSVSFTSQNSGQALILWNISQYDGEYYSNDKQWVDALSAASKPYTVVSSSANSSLPSDLWRYSLIIDLRGSNSALNVSGYEDYLKTSGHVLYIIYHDVGNYSYNRTAVRNLVAAIGGGDIYYTSSYPYGSSTEIEINSAVSGSGGIAEELAGMKYYCAQCGYNISSAWLDGLSIVEHPYNGTLMAYWGPNETNSDTNGILIANNDANWSHGNSHSWQNYEIMQWIVGLSNDYVSTTSTYNFYEDQVKIAGEPYTDASFSAFTGGSKLVIPILLIPLDGWVANNYSGSRFMLPNFVPANFWNNNWRSVGVDYYEALNQGSSYNQNKEYQWITRAVLTESSDITNMNPQIIRSSMRYHIIQTDRFYSSGHSDANEIPEGMSMWWQILNPNGIGTGIWAQVSIKDCYTTYHCYNDKTRDDQQSLLNVLISNIDYRKNDTSRYSSGDTGLGMDGYNYWSYQGPTNVDNNGLGVTYGTSPIECVTSSESGCFWGNGSSNSSPSNREKPGGAMISTSDPYKSGNMTLGVNYNSNDDTFSTGTFNMAAVTEYLYGPLLTVTSAVEFDQDFANHVMINEDCTDSTCAIYALENTDAFAVSSLFYLPSGAPSENYQTTIWGTMDANYVVNGQQVYLAIKDNKIKFFGGRSESNYWEFTGSTTLSTDKWYGIYFTYAGSSGSPSYEDITIKLVDPMTGAVTNAAGSWYQRNNASQWYTGASTKRYYIGNKWAGWQDADDRYLKVANNIMTTLIVGSPQSDEEIATMIIDPKKWVADYKIGKTARLAEDSSTFTFALEDANSYNATKVYIFGDQGVTNHYSNGNLKVFNYIDQPQWSGNAPVNGTYASYLESWISTNSYNGSGSIPSGSFFSDGLEICCTSNPSASISDFRSTDFYASNATSYQGFFSGLMEFDVSGSGNGQLASVRSSSTLASFTFDTTNDDVQVVVPLTIGALPSNNYTSTWNAVDTGSMTLKFGDATNDEAKSAYISSEVFGAEIQDDGAQIDGTSGGSNNLAGVMVSYNTLDKEDSDLFHENDSIPNTDYSTWGFWAMSAVDVSPNAGSQNASVHLGTWVGGEVVAQNEIPTSGTASMSGAAVVNVAYRYNQTDTNYDVHKYTTTANVAGTFNWGTSGYSGTLAFTNFDDENPIIANAGFASFSVAINGTNNIYSGVSTDSLDNSWLGGAAVAGALYGDSKPKESGGRVNVNLYKSGATGTAGANDFYTAEGIYLIDCTAGTCQ